MNGTKKNLKAKKHIFKNKEFYIYVYCGVCVCVNEKYKIYSTRKFIFSLYSYQNLRFPHFLFLSHYFKFENKSSLNFLCPLCLFLLFFFFPFNLLFNLYVMSLFCKTHSSNIKKENTFFCIIFENCIFILWKIIFS